MNSLLDSITTDATNARPKPDFSWSDFQENIFEAGATTHDNLIIEAVAGSGKSTTLTELMNRIPGSGVALAFNKSVATELKSVVPPHIDARTFNSLGASLLPPGFRGKLKQYKIHDLVRERMSRHEYQLWGSAVVGSISAHQNAAGQIEMTPDAWENQIQGDVDIPIDRLGYAASLLDEVWRTHIDTLPEAHTFNDQLWYPVLMNVEFPCYQVVYVDEAQDLNSIKHEFTSRLADRGARLIAVGDTRQAIYAFAGALTTSMQTLKERFDCTELPLSVCYRCDMNIVKHAQTIVPHIQAREGAELGEVNILPEPPTPDQYSSASLIMCRTNAPLFELARKFLSARVPCRLLSNYGRSLVNFVKAQKATTTKELAEELNRWATREIAKAERDGKAYRVPGIRDKRDCILPFCEDYQLKEQVVHALDRLINSKAGAILSTIHKAKGLEATHAYLIRPDLCPAPWVEEGSEEFEQEANLKYVAITRGKHSFNYISEDQSDAQD